MLSVNPYIDWLLQLSEKFKNKIIASFNNEDFTAQELIEKRNKTCSSLKILNISEDDKVAIVSRNSIDFVIELLAIWAIGAIPVPINIKQSENEIIKQLNFVGAKLIFTDIEKEKHNNLFSQFTVYQNNYDEDNQSVPSLKEWKIRRNKTALLMFTSGSSGKPKCVEITFQNLIHSAEGVIELLQPLPEDCWFASLPFYHIGGFSIIIRAFLGGNKLIIPNLISTETISDAVTKGKVNFISLVPTTLQRLLDAKIIPHNNIKSIFLGGGRVSFEIVKEAMEFGYKLITVYGSTETSSMIAFDRLLDENLLTSFAGKPMMNTEYFILNEKGKRLASNVIGEIAINSPSVAVEYYNNPEETNLKFHKVTEHKFKYYLTSDLGKIDEQGRLFIIGRKDDVIISGGENISTIEVTEKIKSFKEVHDAFAFGMSDTHWGQKLCAAVVINKSTDNFKTISAEKLQIQLKELLPSFKIPKTIYFINKIPRTVLGKVIKEDLLSIVKNRV